MANVEDRRVGRIHERAWAGHIGAELHRKGAVVAERDGLVGQVADADVLCAIRLPAVELKFDAGSRTLAAPNPVRLTASDWGEEVALVGIVSPGANAIVEHPTEGVVGISQQMLFEALDELAAEMLVTAGEPYGIVGGVKAVKLLPRLLELSEEMLKGAAEFVGFGHEQMLSHRKERSCMVSPTMSRRSLGTVELTIRAALTGRLRGSPARPASA